MRSAAAIALARFGPEALPTLRAALDSDNDLSQGAAIEAAGLIGGPAVDDMLYTHLARRYFAAVRRNSRWLEMLPPPSGPGDRWAPLADALHDSNQRALETALAVLAALGHRRTLQAMRGILAGGDARSRANAVETIASVGQRRFVQPLLPILELGVDAAATRRGKGTEDQLAVMLAEAADDPNRWICAGALLAAPLEQRRILTFGYDRSDDPIVRDAANFSDDPIPAQETIMNRLMFLRTVPLFEGLSLDDLLSVDEALEREEYLANEIVGTPGRTRRDAVHRPARQRFGAVGKPRWQRATGGRSASRRRILRRDVAVRGPAALGDGGHAYGCRFPVPRSRPVLDLGHAAPRRSDAHLPNVRKPAPGNRSPLAGGIGYSDAMTQLSCGTGGT